MHQPPGVRARFQGLRVEPKSTFVVSYFQPNSDSYPDDYSNSQSADHLSDHPAEGNA